MTSESKAKRATVAIGSLEIDAFMLPDGSYRMSQTQAAEIVQDDPVYARNFLKSKALKALRGEGYTPETFEIDSSNEGRGQTRIQGWPLEIVYAYWVYRCFKGSKPAFSLVMALGSESLERRFDNVFGMERSESDRNQILGDRLHNLERNLEKLGEGFAMEDIVRQERDYLEQWCSDRGLDPWRDIDSSDE